MKFDHVSFYGNFDKSFGPEEPAGYELLQWLESQLKKSGYLVSHKYQTDYSYRIRIVEDFSYELELGYVSDKNSEWLIFLRPLERLRSFFCGERGRKIICQINQILMDSEKVSNIRWYKNTHDWNYKYDSYVDSEELEKFIR